MSAPESPPGPAPGPAPDRLVLLYASDGTFQGTGCLFGGSLVLTAAHLISVTNGQFLVTDPASGRDLHGRLEWTGSSLDLALIRVTDPDFGGRPRLMLGEEPAGDGANRQAEALGFPRYAGREEMSTDEVSAAEEFYQPRPRLARVTGQVPDFSETEYGAFEFIVRSPPATDSGGGSPWFGMSGAPVWIGNRLIGIVNDAYDVGRLRGTRIIVALDDPSFASLLSSPSDISSVPGTVQPPAEFEPPPVTVAPELSRSASEVLSLAAGLAGGTPVDASVVLLAAFRYSYAAQTRGVTRELLNSLASRQRAGRRPDGLITRLNRALRLAEVDPAGADPRLDEPPLSLVLGIAAGVAERVSGHLGIHLRHLVLATVLASDPPLRPEFLAELGVSAAELRGILGEAAHAETTGEPVEVWQVLLSGPPPVPFLLAGGISADRVDPTEGIPRGRDYLGASVWVSMLAAVMTDAGTPMPLSVGIFGEWGSGKSYFMGLLRSEVDRLRKIRGGPYLQHVIQIGFNAWHYTDTNLWASLGDEIFRQLAEPAEKPDEARLRLSEELAKGSTERQALEKRTTQAKAQTERLAVEVGAASAERATKAGDLLTALRQSPELQKQLDKAWQRLGIEGDMRQARILADEVRGTPEEASALRSLLGRQRSWVLAGICLTALLVVAAAALIPASWGRWLAGGGATVLAVALGTGLTWLGRAREGLTSLRRIAADLSSGVVSAKKKETAAEVKGALSRLRQAEADERVAQAELDEVVARSAQLAGQLSELMPGQRLYSFLAERAGGGPYAAQLGLISIIRKDFECLVDLLRDWRSEGSGEAARRPIDRIVLYIDDLDRCRPQQVVDVLQAVHLLLALDLFVVVVGVDPRWLRRSLQHHFHGVLDAQEQGEAADEDLWGVTPNDYLEKIFNIPFALPGIPAGGLEKMLRGLAVPDAPGESAADVTLPEAERPEAERIQPDADEGHQGSAPPGPDGAMPDGAILVEPHSELADSHREDSAQPPRPLSDPEYALLSELEVFVGTPREAKRMFNLYRMLRSTRDLSDAASFLGDDQVPGEYQAVAVLLGMLTAEPHLLGAVFDAPRQAEPPVAGGLMRRPVNDNWRDLVADIAPKESGHDKWANQIIGSIPLDKVPAWQRFAMAAARTSDLVSLPDLAAFQQWAPVIKRFSFVLSPLENPMPPL